MKPAILLSVFAVTILSIAFAEEEVQVSDSDRCKYDTLNLVNFTFLTILFFLENYNFYSYNLSAIYLIKYNGTFTTFALCP